MKFFENYGVAVADMSWTLPVAGRVASPTHSTVATHVAIPAIKRRAAAATVASVNRGTS